MTGSGLRECQTVSCTVKAGVGDTGPAGGKIIYAVASPFTVTGADSFNANYLEAALDNQATGIAWSSKTVDGGLTGDVDVTGATGTAIGTGKANTTSIIAAHSDAFNNAAKYAAAYTGGGKSDWFLPSKDELNEMWKARTHLGISSGIFWSSSQDYSFAWLQPFATSEGLYSTGLQYIDLKRINYNFNTSYNVRAVRAF